MWKVCVFELCEVVVGVFVFLRFELGIDMMRVVGWKLRLWVLLVVLGLLGGVSGMRWDLEFVFGGWNIFIVNVYEFCVNMGDCGWR